MFSCRDFSTTSAKYTSESMPATTGTEYCFLVCVSLQMGLSSADWADSFHPGTHESLRHKAFHHLGRTRGRDEMLRDSVVKAEAHFEADRKISKKVRLESRLESGYVEYILQSINSRYRLKHCKLLWVHQINLMQPLCMQGALIFPLGVILAKILMQVSSSQSREVWPAARRLDGLD